MLLSVDVASVDTLQSGSLDTRSKWVGRREKEEWEGRGGAALQVVGAFSVRLHRARASPQFF